MANAWLLKPLPISSAAAFGSTVQVGVAANLFNDYAGVIFQSAADFTGNVAAVRFDLGADATFDTILVFGVELLPAGAGLSVIRATAAQGYFTGGSTVDNSGVAYAGAIVPVNGKGVSLWSLPTPIAARYVQLSYIGTGAGQSFRASRIVIGRRIQLERNFGYGAGFGVRDLGRADFSRRGVLDRCRGAKLRTAALTFSHIRKDEVEATTKPLLEQLGNTEMVALLTDPAVDGQRQNRAYYGPLVGDLSQAWRNAAAWEAKINLVSIF